MFKVPKGNLNYSQTNSFMWVLFLFPILTLGINITRKVEIHPDLLDVAKYIDTPHLLKLPRRLNLSNLFDVRYDLDIYMGTPPQ